MSVDLSISSRDILFIFYHKVYHIHSFLQLSIVFMNKEEQTLVINNKIIIIKIKLL